MNATQNQTTMNVGDGMTVCGWSDCRAYTIIKATAKTMTLRRDKATLLNGMNSGAADALVAHVGGFCANVQGVQRYEYEQDENGQVIVARLTKKGWMADGRRVIEGRHEHYDYNF